ncbi:hypothetical protein [Pseudomonas sp. 22 E 5]|nr:hypothetical protein [Pseudomonas sp. 22 E 5]
MKRYIPGIQLTVELARLAIAILSLIDMLSRMGWL